MTKDFVFDPKTVSVLNDCYSSNMRITKNRQTCQRALKRQIMLQTKTGQPQIKATHTNELILLGKISLQNANNKTTCVGLRPNCIEILVI